MSLNEVVSILFRKYASLDTENVGSNIEESMRCKPSRTSTLVDDSCESAVAQSRPTVTPTTNQSNANDSVRRKRNANVRICPERIATHLCVSLGETCVIRKSARRVESHTGWDVCGQCHGSVENLTYHAQSNVDSYPLPELTHCGACLTVYAIPSAIVTHAVGWRL
jgi:hypothetical protein